MRQVFERLTEDTQLVVQAVYGQNVFSEEQKRLVRTGSTELAGGHCNLDILVATPGRLLDHLGGTNGFTLQHVQYLVVDETDRLLKQSYSDWVRRTLEAIHKNQTGV